MKYKMPFLRFKVRVNTNCWSWKIERISTDHVLDIDFGIWNFRYFKKMPDKEWH